MSLISDILQTRKFKCKLISLAKLVGWTMILLWVREAGVEIKKISGLLFLRSNFVNENRILFASPVNILGIPLLLYSCVFIHSFSICIVVPYLSIAYVGPIQPVAVLYSSRIIRVCKEEESPWKQVFILAR